MADLSLTPTVGLVGGETIQFALGAWPDPIGSGVALSEDAFDAIEPHLRAVCQEWAHERRYGITELPQPVVAALAQRLRSEAESASEAKRASSKAQLFGELADWLDAHRDGQQPISILGY